MRRPAAAGACLVLLLALALRAPILDAVGRILVVANPVASADVIVVSIDAREEGVLEAADLFHRGVAHQVAVFADPPDEVDREFIRRGGPYFDAAAKSIGQLDALGVTHVVRIPQAVAGTEEEGQILPGWLGQGRFRSVVLVTTSDHSRRVGRVLRRALKGQPATLIVHPSRYSKFDPKHWWKTRGNLRTGIVELQKLFLDVVLHPIS
jgi:hypothetical protein